MQQYTTVTLTLSNYFILLVWDQQCVLSEINRQLIQLCTSHRASRFKLIWLFGMLFPLVLLGFYAVGHLHCLICWCVCYSEIAIGSFYQNPFQRSPLGNRWEFVDGYSNEVCGLKVSGYKAHLKILDKGTCLSYWRKTKRVVALPPPPSHSPRACNT